MMRQLAIGSVALVIAFATVGRCEETDSRCPYLEQCKKTGQACCKTDEQCCQEGKCCEDSAACQVNAAAAVINVLAESQKCQQQASACQGKACPASACESKTVAAEGKACAAGSSQVATKACQAKTAACQTKAKACQVAASACQTKASTCQAATKACQAKTTACEVAAAACQTKAASCACKPACHCKKSQVDRVVEKRIKHLKKAAEHLHAAGFDDEAKHVIAKAKALHHELTADKVAELKRLKVEVARLRKAVAQHQKLLIHVRGAHPAGEHKANLHVGNGKRSVRVIVVALPDQAEEIDVDGHACDEEEIVDAPLVPPAPTAQAPAATRK